MKKTPVSQVALCALYPGSLSPDSRFLREQGYVKPERARGQAEKLSPNAIRIVTKRDY
ncbi:hypothetical protein BN874_1370021 [Candidatus Contendobacter odensis Run_B_J11]|uniref:Uncharacterized protein n=1 Tax=Candidatus Contendobacter odensis Run_B_J11 TaxID=1400861 RepID=A0A7U7J1Q4_9GAMM|nr:hypothetical protein BN874_1370021 [Candidatus Contendobacter odensis Run_B_J11]